MRRKNIAAVASQLGVKSVVKLIRLMSIWRLGGRGLEVVDLGARIAEK